uniref:Aspartic peptidase DDI1-type domain-containing protein n=1 Tax=Nicotiana tabacum TaxID=4097 RepID=A0A1S3XGS3_TOBAC|nr:PREDICTED: uncharacterized protein LOC107765073 [Nicotiana tabacum]
MLKKLLIEHQQLRTDFQKLARQIGQLVAQQNIQPAGALPSDTEKNPTEQVQAIDIRSEKTLEEVPPKKYVPKEVFERLVPQPEVEAKTKDDEHMQEIEVGPPPPFPQRLQKLKDASKYKMFLDILSQLRVNLPLVEVLQEVPKYSKYLRDIMENKRRLIEFETIALTEECSAKCSSSLGASRTTTITLQLADQSLAVPEGIIEDVLVRVGKFIFPIDFIILDYMADEEVQIILGQPLLATRGALVNVREGNLKMRVHDEAVTFNVYKALNLPKHYEGLCMILVVEPKLGELDRDVNVSEKKIEPEDFQLLKIE